ncbi:MAG: hypothetical protein COB17_00395 [Sulfurimonas sp.]|nr:MAG: hypothetical protein COB17_00395 [Sulfurimonas sp.]
MITLLNYWHYIILFIIFVIFSAGIVVAFQQSKKKLIFPMIITVILFSILISGFAIVTIDKYTKVAKLHKLKNKRLLGIEKIIFTGIVRNEGTHEIGTVKFEIKLVNKGHSAGNVKGGSFFKPSGIFDFFSGGAKLSNRPQKVVKEFIVAKNLKPGEAKSFRVYFDYPAYFKNVSYFTELHSH